ncbi:MAG: carboxypeptidase regulatory-like domain-containing protein [Planctomycetota bacterium]|nr:MAG: carboxypeptidase regulatory-like domain-containing protein [Planctomycetota bacterium]
MKETSILLAGAVTVGLLTVSMVLLSRLERPSPPALADGARVGPFEATEAEDAPPDLETAAPEQLAAARVSLGSVPVEAFVRPEAGHAGVVLLRWPDGAPIADTTVRLFGDPGPAIDDYETSPLGRVDLPPELAHDIIQLSILIEGFEPQRVRVGPFADKRSLPRISMRPTMGWYGRVRSHEGRAVANATVSGWWIEAARPYSGSRRVVQEGQGRQEREGQSDDLAGEGQGAEAFTLGGLFVASRGLLSATGSTNAEGYFYIEPLGAEVRGQLTLTAQGQGDFSSDVLRLPLPSARTQLPDLILHRPIVVHGRVVDVLGDPVADAVVLPQFARGWSVDLEPVRTDEDGRFELTAPVEALVVTAEKVGYRMVPTELTKVESLDGLWNELAALGFSGGGALAALVSEPPRRKVAGRLGVPQDALAALGYSSRVRRPAHARERSHLPRTRSFVMLDALRIEARILMKPLPRVTIEVIDALELRESGLRIALEGALVNARYGGLDAQSIAGLTNADGRASFPNADVEWQPVVVSVKADGYHPSTFALEPMTTARRVALEPIDQEGGAGSTRKGPSNGLVLGPDGPVEGATIIAYRAEDYGRRGASPVWRLSTNTDGDFVYGVPEDQPLTEIFYLFAFEGEGASRMAGELGPIRQLELANAQVTVIDIAPAVAVALDLYRLEMDADYRTRVSYAPFPGAKAQIWDDVIVHATDFLTRGVTQVYAPYGWYVRAHVEVALRANAPLVDFIRGGRRQQPLFQSLRTVWTDWQRVTDAATVRYAVPSSVLHFSVAASVDFGGWIGGRPYDVPKTLYVAARGLHGHWIAPVDGNGWFDFCDVPAGSYELMLYSPPDPEAGYSLDSAGQLYGLLKASCRTSRFDLVIDWVEPLE